MPGIILYTWNDYEADVDRTIPRELTFGQRIVNFALGLAGESGEVTELIKKSRFHDQPVSMERLEEELGDVLWYTVALAISFNIPLSRVVRRNVEKLKKRYPNGFSTECRQAESQEKGPQDG